MDGHDSTLLAIFNRSPAVLAHEMHFFPSPFDFLIFSIEIKSLLFLSIRVSLWVSVKLILADILYDLEALRALQVTDYTQQEKSPMLC